MCKSNSLKLMKSSTAFGLLTFLSVFAYCTIWIWQGLDFTDEGYNLSNQWLKTNGYNFYYANEHLRWLSTLTAGAWLNAFKNWGLIGARFGWVMVISITSLITFHILKKITTRVEAFAHVVLVTMIITYHSTLIINYNVLPAFLLIVSIWALFNSQIHVRKLRYQVAWAALCGFFLGLATMARFPLVISIFLPFAPPVVIFWIEKRVDIRLIKLACLSIFFAAIVISCCIVYLHIVDMLNQYSGYIFKMLVNSDNKNEYSSKSLISLILRTGIKSLFVSLIFVQWALLGGFVINIRASKKKTTAILLFSLGLFIPFFAINYYHSVPFMDISVLLYYFTSLLPGLFFLFFFTLLFIPLHINDKKSVNTEHIILAVTGVFYAFVMSLGSGNGVSNAKHGLWLVIPMIVIIGPKLIADMGSCVLKIDPDPGTLKKYFTAVFCTLAITGMTIRFANPYRDSRNRCNLNVPIEHKRLHGVFTTTGRSASVKRLVDQINKYIKRGDTILAYNSIPMVHFLTETIPALGHPWPSIMDYNDLKNRLKFLKESGSHPGIVVRGMTNTRHREWGNSVDIPAPHYNKEIKLIDKYVINTGYHSLWKNRDFQILAFPSALK